VQHCPREGRKRRQRAISEGQALSGENFT
jgi:hypothetical protein